MDLVPNMPEAGIDALRTEWGINRSRKAKYPPVALTPDGPVAVYYLSEVATLPDDTVLVWSWPGQWRNDPYRTTLGSVR